MATQTRTARTNGRTATTQNRSVNVNEVAKVAYELFERRGRKHGYDQQDWFDAERIVIQRQRSTSS